jgi:homoserine dehydrogenase
MRTIRIGIIGLGTVGSGVAKILLKHRADFLRDQGVDIEIGKVSSHHDEMAAELGLTDCFVSDAARLIADPSLDIVVELVGGTTYAKDYIFAALEAGKHVVTANKAVMASVGTEALELAGSKGLDLAFEASVGGGIPIIGAFRNSLIGNRIERVIGIVNGTTNYILSKMTSDGADYATVLGEAQKLGFAEADPSADVDGYDAAAKAAILATLAYNTDVTIDDVYTEGISQITATDIKVAAELGYVIKLLAIATRTPQGIDLRAHPALLPKSHPLAKVGGVMNAVFVVGDAVGETMFYGPGAGSLPAASAVVGDIVEVAQRIAYDVHKPYIRFGTEGLTLLPLGQTEQQYYLRLAVEDRAGALAQVTEVFARHDISIAQMMQHRADAGQAQLIFMTHQCQELRMQEALAEVAERAIVKAAPMLIRVI